MIDSYISNINENTMKKKIKYFYGFDNIIEKYFSIANKTFNENNGQNTEILIALGFGSKILMYGIPGVGKTSIAYSVASYVLDKFGISAYSLSIPAIIKSNLGETTSNMNEALGMVKDISKETGILLILDEIDRLSVLRNNENELAEMKRALLELNDFLDNVSIMDRTLIIGITNHIGILDDGLKRRFDFIDEITPNKKSCLSIIDNLNKLIGLDMNKPKEYQIKLYNIIKAEYKVENLTGDLIKRYYKRILVEDYFDVSKLKTNILEKIQGGN